MVLEFLFNNFTLQSATLLATVLPIAVYNLSGWIYNVYFHPLRRFPGAITWKASRLPYARHLFRGDLEKENVLGNMHAKYGKIVRIAPDTLAFADARAWKDICGHKPGQAENIKDMSHYGSPPKGTARGIVIADEQQHPRYRKLLAPAFGLQALQDQQPIIMKYIDMLVEGLKGEVAKGPVNVGAWMQWCTFDIIGDLTYAESFHGLETQSYHQWILNIFEWVKLGRLMGYISAQYPVVQKLMPYFTPKSLTQRRVKHVHMSTSKVKKRLEEGETGRPDFMTLVLRNQGKDNELTLAELVPNAGSLILAGSETTGTFMGGALFFLARNPAAREKAASEIRSHFANEKEIEFNKVDKLPYLNAVIQETFRMYPPVPSGLDRIVTEPAGIEICGEHIPRGTRVAVHQLPSYTYEGCFHKAKSFIPERWLGDPEFVNDERDIVQPFSYGPRDCIGRNLAYIEMRLILSRLLYSFDMALADPDFDWIGGQKIFGLWEKIPLMMNVKLAPKS